MAPYKNLAVCVVNNKGYIEGEKFQPSDRCLDCVCQKGYNGKFVAPFCMKKRCDVEIRFSNQIVNNCAPIYHENEPLCCPYDFICQCRYREYRGPVVSIPLYGNYNSYELNQCFPYLRCPSKNMSVCVDNHKGYIEGEKFQPLGKCLNCICQKGYNGKYVEPFCMKKRCDIEIKYSKQIVDNCAPIYLKNNYPLCCPYDFICPSNSKIEHLVKYKSTNGEKCKFGTQTFNQYDTLNLINQYNVTFNCRCSIPPLLTCLR
ncbi:PREDICTED: uncharacterized protein LOC108560152 [Nicrophorus vespilloides]|uniref:Uncharacterized protein LOC108560152 n=1 Tax=Nicrophorus vespilloides TaxID=110193 RepID=A0ABM1MET5_NICVS|nr:PREDICTED: uncharacterized protein LOC108560152 [Nicrophorus vespilloides]